MQRTDGRQRWKRRVAIALATIIASVVAIWGAPWLLMPADLRAIQGDWELVRITDPSQDIPWPTTLSIRGEQVTQDARPVFSVTLEPESRGFHLYDTSATKTFLGIPLRLPLWLNRPRGYCIGNYELTDDQLVFHVKADIDPSGQVRIQGGEPYWCKLYLERQPGGEK